MVVIVQRDFCVTNIKRDPKAVVGRWSFVIGIVRLIDCGLSQQIKVLQYSMQFNKCWAKDQILVIAINLSWCKTKYWQVTPTHFFYIFCHLAFDAKEQVGRPYFWSKETKEGQLNETFWIERLEHFLDLENKNSDRRSLTFEFFLTLMEFTYLWLLK
jgi:hypothetical protein